MRTSSGRRDIPILTVHCRWSGALTDEPVAEIILTTDAQTEWQARSVANLERSAMKYTVSIEIALPLERVVQLLADPVQLPKWLRGLVLPSRSVGHTGRSAPRRES